MLADSMNKNGDSAKVTHYNLRKDLTCTTKWSIHNLELGQSIRHPIDTITMLLMIFANHEKKTHIMIIHNFYDKSFLKERFNRFIVEIIYAYQKFILKRLSTKTTLIALDEIVVSSLKTVEVNSRLIPIGTYRSKANETKQPKQREKWGFKKSDILIGLIGHPMKFKRYSEFIRAVKRSPEFMSGVVRFVIIGGDPKRDSTEYEAIKSEIDGMPNEMYVETGYLDEISLYEDVKALNFAALPYKPMWQASAVLSLVTGQGIPCIVSQSPVFDGIVEAEAAERISESEMNSGSTLYRKIILLDEESMRRNTIAFAESHSIEKSARTFIEVLRG